MRAAAASVAAEVEDLRHRYGVREALAGVSFGVARGEIFGLLGPNGSGKTTLFKILATLLPATGGRVRLLGLDPARETRAIRRRLGVVFQHPGLDPKLTVLENLRHHGHLFGMRGRALAGRAQALLGGLGLDDRAHERVETLSGGLARRVELAKALLSRPELLVLDEPSAGLDPGARLGFVAHLERLRREDGVTVLLTTHLLEEAERCDRVGILDRGQLVALDTPGALKERVGGDVVVIHARDPEALRAGMRDKLGLEPTLVDGHLRLEHPRAPELVREVVEAFGDEVTAVSFGKPTLEDVFIRLTGRRLREGGPS